MATGALAPGPVGTTTGTLAAPLSAAAIPTPASAAWALLGAPAAGPLAPYAAPVAAGLAAAGCDAPGHDAQWFERVHVLPRRFDLGQVASQRVVQLEVWNAHRRTLRLWDVTTVGSGDVAYDGAFPPFDFKPFHSEIYTLHVPAGTGAILSVLTWLFRVRTGASVFTSFDTPGADVTVAGTGTLLFTARPNGLARVRERYGYPTDVIVAWDRTEQRVGLRARPLRDLRFRPTLVDAAEGLEVMAKLYLAGAAAFAVPVWPDAVPLGADVAGGATSVTVATGGRAFTAGGSAILWRDQWTAEAVAIDTVFSDHLTLASPVGGNFAAAGTLVAPLEAMRLLEAPPLERSAGGIAEIDLAFTGEGV